MYLIAGFALWIVLAGLLLLFMAGASCPEYHTTEEE